MIELVIRILVNAAAVWVAVQVLPDNLLSFDFGNDWWKLLAVALVVRARQQLHQADRQGPVVPDQHDDPRARSRS